MRFIARGPPVGVYRHPEERRQIVRHLRPGKLLDGLAIEKHAPLLAWKQLSAGAACGIESNRNDASNQLDPRGSRCRHSELIHRHSEVQWHSWTERLDDVSLGISRTLDIQAFQ